MPIKEKNSIKNFVLWERVTGRDLALFARQLAILLDLGLTVLRALSILHKRTTNRKMAKIVAQMVSSIERGQSLSSALQEFPNHFSEFFITSVRAGEESGKIEKILNEVADYLEKEEILRGKIVKSLSFPVLTLFVALGVISFLLIFVIPTFVTVYENAGVELPFVTKMVIGISSFFLHFWWMLILPVGFIFLFFFRSGSLIGMRRVVDRMKLTFPIIREAGIKIAISRFARTTATLLDSGVPILMTLKLAAEATENTILHQQLLMAIQDIDRGRTIEQSIAINCDFPPLVTDMIGVGEEVGAVGLVLRKIALFYERDVDDFISNLTVVIEPLLTLFIGLMVLIIALSMFLPYLNINQVIIHSR